MSATCIFIYIHIIFLIQIHFEYVCMLIHLWLSLLLCWICLYTANVCRIPPDFLMEIPTHSLRLVGCFFLGDLDQAKRHWVERKERISGERQEEETRRGAILLMTEILHHLRYMKAFKEWDKLATSTGWPDFFHQQYHCECCIAQFFNKGWEVKLS